MNIREFTLLLRHRLLDLSELFILLLSFLIISLLFWLGDIFLPQNFILFLKGAEQYFPIPIQWVKLILWTILFLVIKWSLGKSNQFFKTRKTYIFDCSNWKSEWIFHGKSSSLSNPDRIVVFSSRAGCLMKKYIWKNFEMSFEMKFLENVSQKRVGIIFRARDLENYFMLEIAQNGELIDCISVKPHIRIQAAWEIVQEESLGNLDLSEFKKIKLRVINEKAHLYVSGKGVFEWHLPTHIDINHIEAGSGPKTPDPDIGGNIIPKIDFRTSYGMIGFRAHPGQGAEIKELEVKRIDI